MGKILMGVAMIALAIVLTSGTVLADRKAAVQFYSNGQYPQALAEFQKLAAQGDVKSQFNLAIMHDKGQGTAANQTEAFRGGGIRPGPV